MDAELMAFLWRWLHVISGVMWIGLLWYFNFVQIPNMGKIPDDQKPAIGKIIAPAALFWFRWSAMATIVTGLILATYNGYILDALALRATQIMQEDRLGIVLTEAQRPRTKDEIEKLRGIGYAQ